MTANRLPVKKYMAGGLHMAAGIGGASAQQVFVQALDRKYDIKSSAETAQRKSEDIQAKQDGQDIARRSQRAEERGGIDIDVSRFCPSRSSLVKAIRLHNN